MKAVLISNMLSHHMLPLSRELRKICDDFTFVATENITNIGFQYASASEYMLRYYEPSEKQIAVEKILNADFVIFGSCPNELIELRMAENKLSFLYSERFFKKGTWRRFIPSTRKALYNRAVKFKDNNFFVLCASAYLPYDLSLLGVPASKCVKWGYFPECDCVDDATIDNKEKGSILWAGRMLDWKHPEVAIKVASELKHTGVPFKMTVVGEGPKKLDIEKLVEKYGLSSSVSVIGAKSHDELMQLMREHSVLMFTSDFYEGWGAVLNEAMSNGCAVVASHAIGSVPYLLSDGVNGKVYRYGDIKEACKIVKELAQSQELCAEYGKNALYTIKNEYSCKVAAERIYSFAKAFLNGEEMPTFDSGVMSNAEVLKNNWKD